MATSIKKYAAEGTVLDAKGCSLALTFDCGQCFRFEPTERGTFEGVAFGEYVEMSQPEPGKIVLHGVAAEDAEKWNRFLTLDTDWEQIKLDVASRSTVLADAAELAGGIRILKQDEFEALISFVISQCNNIPRIKGLISAISKSYGKEIPLPDGRVFYSFPDAETLASLPLSELRALKLGYRAE